MNEEIDEADFYHQDFTTATDWEIFTARLEEIIQEWKLPSIRQGLPLRKNQLSTSKWDTLSEEISFADVDFKLTRYFLKFPESISPPEVDEDENQCQVFEDLMSVENDFCLVDETNPAVHPIARWYGLRDFVVLTPARNMAIDNESKIKILLSSANIAVANSNSQVPLFIKILEPGQHVYVGVCETRGLKTNFDIIHLKRTPSHSKYLTGLLDIFKGKVGVPLPEPANVSVRLSYSLQDWTSSVWSQEPPDFELLQGEAVGLKDLGTLPFGATFDPISELLLFCTWPQLPENLVIDSQNYSDFDAMQAPSWSVRVRTVEKAVCLLSECLAEFLQLGTNNCNMRELLGSSVVQKDFNMMAHNPLDKLTESSVPTISSVLFAATRSRNARGDGPLQEELLMSILYYLFPDAQDNPLVPYDLEAKESLIFAELCRAIKSSPVGGLVWRLGILLAVGSHWLGGARAVGHLWYEFTQEMRFRCERNIVIPGLGAGFPDPRTCLLHQKLQMLNCCIERRKVREEAANNPERSSLPVVEEGTEFDSSDSSNSDDEFFDCNDDNKDDSNSSSEGKKRVKHSIWNEPVGRLSKFGSVLLKNGEPLYIPITQEPVVKTEDQLEDDAEVMLQLGTDAHGSELRARMMSASLLSDMESFKAANPGSVLEDFIKWYSPRDWIEQEELDEFGQKKGHLSARMEIPGNTWVTVWESAKPVPARRQKRLFDDTKEAEKVLHFLESRKMSQIMELVIPSLIHSSIVRLLEEITLCPELKDLPEIVKTICAKAGKLSHDVKTNNIRYEALCSEIAAVEASVAQCKSLRHKFNVQEDEDLVPQFISGLLNGIEVSLPGAARGPLGLRVSTMFSEARRASQLLSDHEEGVIESQKGCLLPPPVERQFILRAKCSRPSSLSTISPQFLRAVLKRDEFRLVGAFSSDTIFI